MEQSLVPHDDVAGECFGDNTRQPRRRGRPTIDDTTLFNGRVHLLAVAASTWPEIVLGLRSARKLADLDAVLGAWEPHRHAHRLISALLMKSSRPVTVKTLRALERRQERLSKLVDEADELRRLRRNPLEKVMSFPIEQLSPGQKEIIEAQRAKHKLALDTAEAGYVAAQRRLADVIREINEAHSYLARKELLRFCGTNRYEMTPVNLANALAGSPYLEYRQSIKRCMMLKAYNTESRKLEPLKADNGLPYHTIKVVTRVIDSCKDLSKLAEYMEHWLRKPVSKSVKGHTAIVNLRTNWYYMRGAVVTILCSQPRTSELPAKITAKYFEMLAKRTSTDELLAEDEHIVVK